MGGNAFNSLIRIPASEILSIVFDMKEKLELQEPIENLILGSASDLLYQNTDRDFGDIDINIDSSKYDIDTIYQRLMKFINPDNIWLRRGNHQIFVSYPGKNGNYQIDLMFGNINWQKFSFDSTLASKYKGLFRTELLKAIVTSSSDSIYYEHGSIIARSGPTFFHHDGLHWRHRIRPISRNKRLSSFKIIDELEYYRLFPMTEKSMTSFIGIDDINAWWPWEVDVLKIRSYEQALDMLSKKPRKSINLDMISAFYLDRLNSLKVNIPDEIFFGHFTASQRFWDSVK